MMKRKTGAFSANNRIERGHRRWWSAGFTMAEALIVIGILGVLASVSFVAVQTYERNMTQAQYDTIAKEIFVAAQNHLTLAKSENYRGLADVETTIADVETTKGHLERDDIYYFYGDERGKNTILDQMLPFGAIDLVSGGNFIIRYQPKAARVLDVFYWTNGESRFDAKIGVENKSGDYDVLMEKYTGDNHKNYEPGGLLGWCGGEVEVQTGEFLEAPVIEVVNGEKLLVKVTDTNTNEEVADKLKPQLKLIVSGENGAKVAIPVQEESNRVTFDDTSGKYHVVLDDITHSDLHFADIKGEGFNMQGDFIPGENITIQAVAYSNDVLTSVMYSGEWTTNSLFGEAIVNEETLRIGEDTITTFKADEVHISNIRHLENLNDQVSSVPYGEPYFGGAIKAVQTVDLDWEQFLDSDLTGSTVNIFDKEGNKTKDNCFLPVSASYTLNYDGQSTVEIKEPGTEPGADPITVTKKENHSITGIVVDDTEISGDDYTAISAGGVFGALTNATIKNLALVNTSVTLTSGSAGALAGTLANCTVENVVAYNNTSATTTNVAASGNVGGLIGTVTGDSALIKKSAAALVVSSTNGNAGGLIGNMEGGSLTGCYSGGHTNNGGYFDDSDAAMYNVQAAAGTAGGLIGVATNMDDVSYCYSTCSAKGAIAGGFAGTYAGKSGAKLENCYATGLVCGTDKEADEITIGTGIDEKYYKDLPKDGAFAYSLTGLTVTNVSKCYYYEMINERIEREINEAGRKLYTIYATKPDTSGSKDSYVFLTALGKLDKEHLASSLGITPLDATAESYNAFVGSPSDNTDDPDNPVPGWTNAMPYDGKLREYYSVKNDDDVLESKYNLKNVVRLGATLKEEDTDITKYYVATHYGDWPAPEIFVINT